MKVHVFSHFLSTVFWLTKYFSSRLKMMDCKCSELGWLGEHWRCVSCCFRCPYDGGEGAAVLFAGNQPVHVQIDPAVWKGFFLCFHCPSPYEFYHLHLLRRFHYNFFLQVSMFKQIYVTCDSCSVCAQLGLFFPSGDFGGYYCDNEILYFSPYHLEYLIWLIDSSINSVVHSMSDSSIDWSVDWSITFMMDWLIEWLNAVFAQRVFPPVSFYLFILWDILSVYQYSL